MKSLKQIFISALILFALANCRAEDGYRLWLRYDLISNESIMGQYINNISAILSPCESPTSQFANNELQKGLNGLLGREFPNVSKISKNGTIVCGTPGNSSVIRNLKLEKTLSACGDEGYIIKNAIYRKKRIIVIAANTDAGLLYGAFHFLRLLQTNRDITGLNFSSSPKISRRLLNHWDNLDGSVERGYAGMSLWDWNALPGQVSERYTDYARANASIGINGTVLTNVNADARILTRDYLIKVAALADVFRPWNLKVYLTARFSAPVEIGGLKTADPLDPEVIAWWKHKADEIYSYIPDFGGFLVKANSEGQPGPQNYGRSHADGANLLAGALSPHGGIVMWRAFVYDQNIPDDRAKQAYNEFVPLDGKFLPNVLVQVKNGPIDFQPREPFHPLFGAMPKTPVMMEFQITQEYLGFSKHLVFLAPLYEECLKSDTWSNGRGSTVARVIDGSLEKHTLSAIAGVSNIGNDTNWTGHPFAQANWFAYGRLAWDPYLGSSEIAEEWLRMSFTNDNHFVAKIKSMMLASREIAVNYMTPLGLHHIMYAGLHYGPGPWVSEGRADWTSVYYHRADSIGLGFERSSRGSNAVGQYFPEVRTRFESPESCPENLLLWFHHIPWDYKLSSGRTLWDELCFRYNAGVDSVRWLKKEWSEIHGMIDEERYSRVEALLSEQEENARVWRDACLLYFQTFSKRPVPAQYEPPEHNLDYYKNLKYAF